MLSVLKKILGALMVLLALPVTFVLSGSFYVSTPTKAILGASLLGAWIFAGALLMTGQSVRRTP